MLGFGLGLRPTHYSAIEASMSGVAGIDWFEIISENYMVPGGPPLRHLDRIRARYPMVMHGVSLSIGSTAPLDPDYLHDLKNLAARVQPAWISDHLCWTGIAGLNMHDLLPLPFTEEALDHVAARVHQVQDYLGRPILLENTSSYVTFTQSVLPEWEFLAELTRRTGCQLLLDVNNVYVNAFNHGFDARLFIDSLPRAAVRQIHLAGHQNNGTHIVDTHDHPMIDAVWDLYAHAIGRLGPVATMIERDDNIPPLAELVAELDRARVVAAAAMSLEAVA
ncbi:DUF692 domain-containing protein [Dongia sp.]|uniref:MNIO family bufferin maturase n=1 Tax=Dongia sp. TaxID=1977262 RepID=UPI0035B06C38